MARNTARLRAGCTDAEGDATLLSLLHSLRDPLSRSPGPGGQSVNTSDTRVELVFDVVASEALTPAQRARVEARLASTLVNGAIVVVASEHRSQHRNRAEAMAMMKAKLYELELRKRQAEQQKLEDSKTDIGWGHQIRSYVLDQSRIKDLRTNHEVGDTQRVLDGDLDDFIAASLKQGVQ